MTALKTMFPAALTFLLAGCIGNDICNYVDCAPAPPNDLTFSIVDSAGQDLVFGPAARYRADQIQIIEAGGGAGPVQAVYGYAGSTDSSLQVVYTGHPDVTLYLRLSAQDTDTLQIGHSVHNDQCCGTSFTLHDLHHDGKALTQTNGRYHFQK